MPEQPIPSLIVGLGGTGALVVRTVKEQLLNIYDNEVPENVRLLVFDTAKQPLAQYDDGLAERKQGQAFGSIDLDATQYGHVGGDAKRMVESAARYSDKNKYLSSWLLSDWYIKNLKETDFLLENGAGQYRQLGRLAAFRDVAAPNNSSIYRRLNDSIAAIQGKIKDGRSMQVFVTGSLAGGTGAGMFLDISYLIKRIAKHQNVNVQLRGFFFLPLAFRANLGLQERNQAQGRTFAALRELSRFMTFQNMDLGYPFYYHPDNGSAVTQIWRNKLQEKLYDLVYLIDGQCHTNPLNHYPLQDAIAPSISDAILGFLGSASGEYHRAYISNMSNKINNEQIAKGYIPHVGGLGTYSLILPIQQIVDYWGLQMAKESLDLLLKPKFSDTSSVPVGLFDTGNMEREHSPMNEVETLLEGNAKIIDQRSSEGDVLSGTRLWSTIWTWYVGIAETRGTYADQLARYDAERWVQALQPTSSDRGTMGQPADRKVVKILETRLEDVIQLSDEQDPKGNPETDYRRIKQSVDSFFSKYLGNVRGTDGQRGGGMFEEALEDFVLFQTTRFLNAIEAYVHGQLNGENYRSDVARSGKLGWTISVMSGLRDVLTEVLGMIHDLRSNNRVLQQARTSALQGMDDAYQDMEHLRSEVNAPMMGLTRRRSPADQAQHDYRNIAQEAYETLQIDIVLRAFDLLISEERRFVENIVEQLAQWQTVLATHHDGLYSSVQRNIEQLSTQLRQASSIPSRELLYDPKWVEERYKAYRTDDKYLQFLSSVNWDVEMKSGGDGKPVVHIGLKVNDVPLRDDEKGEWAKTNANRMISFCRDMFTDARERESVLNYLAEHYVDNEFALARKVFENSGALLGFNDADAGGVEPAFYLSVNQQNSSTAEVAFLESFKGQLNQLYGIGEGDATLGTVLHGDDRFRVSVVSMVELLPITVLQSYKDAEVVYRQASTIERQYYHIFPAEVQAVKYEDQLTKQLNMSRRWLSDRVSILLEDIQLFREFHSLMAHHVIAMDRDDLNPRETLFTYYLTTSPVDPTSARETEDWWLTEPSSYPSILEAMYTYVFRGDDVGQKKYDPNYTNRINYDHVRRYLKAVKEEDTLARLDNYEEEIATFNQDLFDLIDQYDEDAPEFMLLARLIVQHDVLKEHEEYLQKGLQRAQTSRQNVMLTSSSSSDGQRSDQTQLQEYQDLIDLYTISIVVVREMANNLRRDAYVTAGYNELDINAPNSDQGDVRGTLRKR